ncbi:MAG TPA: redoxin domain-containing protein [Acidisphaera sp.]|nr:redoxin domain-containing protein [Acidisphaera sp.]
MPRTTSAAPVINQPAPVFTATDSNGQRVSLAELRGKIVVLEWTNDGCPFVGKWYRSGAMQSLQRQAAQLGAVWLSVISSAPGEQGYADGARANQLTASRDAAPAHVLLDPTGALGHLYDAETTPHIFVIDAQGVLRYMGGADSVASTRVSDLQQATPYAKLAIEAVAAGAPVPYPVTRPYGCTVKYAA